MSTAHRSSTASSQGSSGLRGTSSGRITGGWVRAANLPSARGFSRGYDRKAVDDLLAQTANGVDWLNGLLVGAENEIDRLTGGVGRPTGRTLFSSSHGKRSAQAKATVRRPRLRSAARPGRVRA